MIKRFNLFALVVLMSVSLMGCTATQKWMGGGAAVGALTGGIWANNSHGALDEEEGALIGAVTGATAGALIGSAIDYNTMEKLKAENAELRVELDKAKAEIDRLRRENDELKREIERLKGSQMEATLLSDVLFAPGSARLTAEGQKVLTDIASRITGQYGSSYVQVQGYTDSQPIKYSKWDDNWQLGAGRALTVLRFLAKQGVSADRLSATSFGETRPVMPNTSPENMRQNRRVDIVVRPMDLAVRGGQGAAVSTSTTTGTSDRPAAGQGQRRRGRRGAGQPTPPPAQ